jgi:metal-dependent amidase/aminoacylase/carboxypeptidase family protein
MNLRDDAQSMAGELIQLRRALHRTPEVGLALPRTQEAVLGALDGLPLEISTGAGLSSVTGVLRGARPGPTVLLRGDMDALPVTERTGLDYAADGNTMHACGHDLHTTMLVGAARLLAAHRDRLAGNVLFMFQPGEEGFDGGTLVDLIHSGLPEPEAPGHADGWAHFLPRLVVAAAGGDAGPDPWRPLGDRLPTEERSTP